MNEIKLLVKDEHLETVLTILHNLKVELLDEIKTDAPNKPRATQYQAKMQKVIYEEESGINDRNGKYASASTYKQRLKNHK